MEFFTLFDVKMDIEAQQMINCCRFKIFEKPCKVICKCKYCGANVTYNYCKNKWIRAQCEPHAEQIIHPKGTFIKDVLLTRMHQYMKSNSQDKTFPSMLAHLRVIYNDKVLPNDTARKIYNETFEPDWITNWRQLPAYIEALNSEGIYSEITYKTEYDIDKIYIELPFAEQLCKSKVFTNTIMFDGTFLKPSTTNGVLLIMMTITADHISIPIACALVESEDHESYQFFFEKTKHIFEDQSLITVISDQHAGIISALGDTAYKFAPCAFHIIQRYIAARDDFFQMVKADHIALYRMYLDNFKIQHPGAYAHIEQYLSSIVRILGAPNRFGYISDSPIEGINGRLAKARKHEVIYLLDAFVDFSFKQYEKQIKKLEKYPAEPLTNRITSEKILMESAHGFTVLKQNIEGTFRVTSPYIGNAGLEYYVTINEHLHKCSCSCGMEVETNSPCIHIVQAMKSNNIRLTPQYYGKMYDRTENLAVFTRDLIRNTPVITNLPINSNIIIRPLIKRRPGRPKKLRRYKPTHERIYSKQHTCSICNMKGHYEKSHLRNPLRFINQNAQAQAENHNAQADNQNVQAENLNAQADNQNVQAGNLNAQAADQNTQAHIVNQNIQNIRRSQLLSCSSIASSRERRTIRPVKRV